METVKLSDLKVTNPYLRLGTDVSELEKSIQTVGLIAPLVISRDNTILAGGRRYQALLNLGYTEAPALVVEKDELERELISIDENLVRKSLNKVEIEAHLRRAKEIYESLTPWEEQQVEDNLSSAELETSARSEQNEQEGESSSSEESTHVSSEQSEEVQTTAPKKEAKKEILPAQKFLDMVSEKTGFSPRQIHQAISRDEKACDEIKVARKNGELAISHTNELIKLSKEEQPRAMEHLKNRPVKEVKKFVKLAKTKGIDQAIEETPDKPHAREFLEIESLLKKLKKHMERLEMEGIGVADFPEKSRKIFEEIFTKSNTDNAIINEQSDSTFSEYHPTH